MNIGRVFLAFTLCLALGACVTVADGPSFKPVAAGGGKGVAYVYSVGGIGESPVIGVDGKEAGRLQAKGYIAIPVSAGTHKITMRTVVLGMKMLGRDVEVNVPSGGAVYLKVEREYGGMGFGPGGPYPIYLTVMNKVSPEVGRAEISQTKQSAGV